MIFDPKNFGGFLRNQNQGYTILEVTLVTILIGVIGALAAPNFFNRHNNPVTDGISQVEQILQQIQGRAIATTSAVRLKVDQNNPEKKLSMEIATTRGCESTSYLKATASNTDTDLRLLSTKGFVVGDKISVGNDSDNNDILAIDKSTSTITLGSPLGSAQPINSKIEIVNNWIPDGALLPEDLTLPENAKISSNIPDWTICFNSRGIAYLYDNNGSRQDRLILTVQNTITEETKDLSILKGGVIEKD